MTLAPPPKARLQSLDAYRGFVMLVLATGAFGLREIPKDAFAAPWVAFIVHHVHHAAWAGCTAWDLVQPAFMFMVGLAMPYSYAARASQGDDDRTQAWHALRRAAVLVLLGVFLASDGMARTNFSFDNVLAQIGLGYPLAFLTLRWSNRTRLGTVALLLVGTWVLFAVHPVTPGGTFSGFFAHWNQDTNAASAADRWFLNLFPQGKALTHTEGGYQTLNFLPAVANMVAGILAADVLRSGVSIARQRRTLLVAGGLAVLVGTVLGATLCPVVKRIWTPSFAILSAGWTTLLLAAFHEAVDVRGKQAWARPLIPMGMNSLVIYLLIELARPWIADTLRTHGGRVLSDGWVGSFLVANLCGLILWWVARWMYERKLFIRI